MCVRDRNMQRLYNTHCIVVHRISNRAYCGMYPTCMETKLRTPNSRVYGFLIKARASAFNLLLLSYDSRLGYHLIFWLSQRHKFGFSAIFVFLAGSTDDKYWNMGHVYCYDSINSASLHFHLIGWLCSNSIHQKVGLLPLPLCHSFLFLHYFILSTGSTDDDRHCKIR